MPIVFPPPKSGKNTTTDRTATARARAMAGIPARTIVRRRRKKMIRSDQEGREENDLFRSAEEESFHSGVRTVYTEQEYNALVAESQKRNIPLVRDMIVILAGTGLRYEELDHLRRKNVHWDTPIPTIEIRAQNGWTPKDPREVKSVPMLPEVQDVIRRRLELCQADDDLVLANKAGHPICPSWTREKLQEMFPLVGIDGGRRLHWHSFRNYFIIRCLKKGVAVNAIMRWTGHDSASMVLHYARAMGQEDVFAEFRKVS